MRSTLYLLVITTVAATRCGAAETSRPNIVLMMADDMGWGQTGYYGHPVLKTPHLDAMAANGLRFDRFYAGAPNCSPTRATVMTGRSNDRTAVQNHGYPLRLQERTIAQALRDAGYATAHFGKWHLNGLRGPGAPVLSDDLRHPGVFGFDHWLSVTNFFDVNPILSRQGEFVEFVGDSSEIIVAEALRFIRGMATQHRPFFTVVWYGSPHSPWRASVDDAAAFQALDARSRDHYGELVAMDRSLGALRAGLRDMGIADNTLVWFFSDNGGLSGIEPDTVGGLRGHKGTLYEGGLRVPAIIEWPAVITSPRVTEYPAATLDVFPTLAEITGLPDEVMLRPQDGRSLRELFTVDLQSRDKPLPFRHQGRAAVIDNQFKLISPDVTSGEFVLYDLARDPRETTDVSERHPAAAQRLRQFLTDWNQSVERSVRGLDYPEARVTPPDPPPRAWNETDEYRPYFDDWKLRPEFKGWLTRTR